MEPLPTSQIDSATWWIAGGALLLLGVALVWIVRRSRSTSEETIPVVELEAQLEQAQQRAERAEATVKQGLIPHLARLLRAKLVVGLVQQRSELVQTQQEGTEKVAELEKRLATAHADLQDKLATYERRLGELQPPGSRTGPKTAPEPSAPSLEPLRLAGTRGQDSPTRRNPLLPPVQRPAPEPLRFQEMLAKRHHDSAPVPSAEAAKPPEAPPAPEATPPGPESPGA